MQRGLIVVVLIAIAAALGWFAGNSRATAESSVAVASEPASGAAASPASSKGARATKSAGESRRSEPAAASTHDASPTATDRFGPLPAADAPLAPHLDAERRGSALGAPVLECVGRGAVIIREGKAWGFQPAP